MLTEKSGFEVVFIDAPAKPKNEEEMLHIAREKAADAKLFVLDMCTPPVNSDLCFADALKRLFSDCFITLIGAHSAATVTETMGNGMSVDAIAIARREFPLLHTQLFRYLRGAAVRQCAIIVCINR